MFGLLNSSQIYGLQQAHEHHMPSNNNNTINNNSNNNSNNSNTNNNYNSKSNKHRRISSSVSDNRFFASLAAKAPTNFIEKFLKTDLLNGYDTIKNYKNIQHLLTANLQTSTLSSSSAAGTSTTSTSSSTLSPVTSASTTKPSTTTTYSDTILAGFNCLQGSYRTSCDSEFYEAINPNINTNGNNINNNYSNITVNNNTNSCRSFSIKNNYSSKTNINSISNNKSNQQSKSFLKIRDKSPEMTIKCSKNLLAEPPQTQAPATLQNYQKLPDDIAMDILIPSSGASSGEFNSGNDNGTNNSAANNLYKRLSWGSRNSKNFDLIQGQTSGNEVPSDNSTSSISTTTQSSTNTTSTSTKSNDLQRSSSASSSGDCTAVRERKKTLEANMTANGVAISPERAQRRKLMQMISSFEQQNKLLQRELAKEKRRRTEELACVVKSLLCFEAKLKNDMKNVNQRLMERDIEICRLVSQNRTLRKKLKELKKSQNDQACDEGVVEDDGGADESLEHIDRKPDVDVDVDDADFDDQLMADCLVLEALQCINCKKQFYDIDLKENAESVNGCTQNINSKDGNRKHDNHHTAEQGSSSDDTVSSSFYGARRSVRYTSKRTSGTFRDYMRSRSMNIDDPALEQNSEENTSTISRDDSQTSYEKLNVYSRTIERMHGVKSSPKDSDIEQQTRASSRLSNKSTSSKSSTKENKVTSQMSQKREQIEEDDGIFSPTQDDDFDEFGENIGGPNRSIKIVPRRSAEFSEASPKQVYETSTDDWYASASDQEEITVGAKTTKSYGQDAVNPVLECVNQILLQQSMEEGPSIDEPSPTNIVVISEPTTPLTSKPSNLVHSSNGNLPRRSSLSGRRSSRSNSHSSDGGQNSRNGTLTRKRVHFSTKNSMVHVPRNDEDDDDDESVLATPMISSLQSATYHQAIYSYGTNTQISSANTPTIAETLNYESIYSNEYEPIGSEHNSSNLYVDMDAANKHGSPIDTKTPKMPPALPPKPANLLKFKKSLQQLDESPDEHLPQDSAASVTNSAASEPDYCSISEVNVAVRSVQIVADVHKVPESVASLETRDSELDLEVSTVASDDEDLCGASQKTDEIEEIFADIPKLPNVAAIIAPKEKNQGKLSVLGQQHMQQNQNPTLSNDYMLMTPKMNSPNTSLNLPNTTKNSSNISLKNTTIKSPNNTVTTKNTSNNNNISTKINNNNNNNNINNSNSNNDKNNKLLSSTPQRPNNLRLDLGNTPMKNNLHGSQYKRKHMPNILAEINKRMSQPNSPTTPTKPTVSTPTKNKQQLFPSSVAKTKSSPLHTPQAILKSFEDSSNSLPLQAEFDWYNLDAEYGRTPSNMSDQIKLTDTLNSNGIMLEEIIEDHESIVAAADEYNLDEEFSLISEPDDNNHENLSLKNLENLKIPSKTTQIKIAASSSLCETINFPLLEPEGSPVILPNQGTNTKATKIRNNLANFEKFIEGSGLSTKPLPSKRKIYFAGPFV